jgi:hypothetical protein
MGGTNKKPPQVRFGGSIVRRVGRTIVDAALGLLAWALVLGLGYGIALLAKWVPGRVLLVLAFALFGLVILAAALAARRRE